METLLPHAPPVPHERRGPSRPSPGASFLPGLVHELRNFAFGVSASLDAFEARMEGQEASRYGEAMRTGLDRLNAFIEELREYGDPQALRCSGLALEPLLEELIERLQPLAQCRGARLRLHCEAPLPTVWADPEWLGTGFTRLLDLALQQEGPGGCLTLAVASRVKGPRKMVYGYLDSPGLQIRDLDLTRLFEPFYYRVPGLGRLALPVARRIFECHGGDLAASSGPEGGLRLGFMLPGI